MRRRARRAATPWQRPREAGPLPRPRRAGEQGGRLLARGSTPPGRGRGESQDASRRRVSGPASVIARVRCRGLAGDRNRGMTLAPGRRPARSRHRRRGRPTRGGVTPDARRRDGKSDRADRGSRDAPDSRIALVRSVKLGDCFHGKGGVYLSQVDARGGRPARVWDEPTPTRRLARARRRDASSQADARIRPCRRPQPELDR
jgi:hypothetical protein